MHCPSNLHILAKLYSFDFIAKGKFSDALKLMVVPEHDLVAGPLGASAASNEGQNVAPEEHLDYTDASVQFYSHKYSRQ